MSNVNRVRHLFVFAVFIMALTSSLVFANDVGERVVKRGVIDDDIYLAGGEVELAATVKGDVVAAGGELDLDGEIQGDVMAAGGKLTLRSHVSDDARLAGGEVSVLGSVGDDVLVAGGRLRLGRDAKIGGRVWLSGGDIRVDSDIAQELRAMGGRVRINGKIQGDVYVRAEKIDIDADAVIHGNLYTQGPHAAHIAKGARIDGEVRHTRVEVSMAPIIGGLIIAALVLLLSLMLTGVVLYLIFPRFTESCARSLREAPWPSLGFGLAVFAGAPVVITILFSTGVGVGLALLLLAAYLIMLLLGYLTGAFFVGAAGLRLLGKKSPGKAAHVVALCVALLVLIIVQLIPLLGILIFWLVLLAGIGALKRQMFLAYQGSRH